MRIAFVAFPYYRAYAALSAYNESSTLKEAFAARGATLDVIAAPDPSVDWASFDAVLPLGCWGYHEDARAFLAWVDELEARGARLLNPPSVLRWNVDKAYLCELRAAGVAVAPFLHFPRGSRPDLAGEIAAAGYQRFVVKPTISANAARTLVADAPPGPEVLALVEEILGSSGLLVQPFFEEIPRDGEWSILFFNGKVSHAVCKLPKPGDFRSQPDHGATVTQVAPSAAVVAQAEAALRAMPGRPTYARVDGFLRDGQLQLVELELIEPHLFIQAVDSGAAGRFCDAVLATLRT
ncbi:ATP-grasp domain-containing protein [Chondromyces apiculatus]|uniref:Prokaryotic glutathione synthetase ATP-binding domain-containing protein n=1 Tax=Chondromyces apiculatus DSM 436 TaxID=1192034 RepID=A0A017T2W1_9BACT|nr:hypothetical protein [Chondromyces apiculatus]EYF03347.1 Hypothetical protein CAP_5679 [Chondromyces apiculatus DSM 436]